MSCLSEHSNRLTAILAALFLIIGIPLISQQYEYRVETIPLKGEFSNFFGSCFLQDSDGFMWLGSSEGLYRYQGNSTKIFRYDPEDENSISNDYIYDLYEDSQEAIWIGTGNGLNRYDRYTESFRRFQNKSSDTTSIVEGPINDIVEDHYHNLWVATNGGFCRFDRESETFTNYRISREDHSVMKYNYQVYSLFPYTDDTLWVFSDAGIYRFHIPSGNIKKIFDDEINYSPGMFKDRSGRYWLSTVNGIFYMNRQKVLQPFIIKSDNSGKTEDQHLGPMLEDSSGNIWMRTLDAIYCYSQELELLYCLEHSFPYPVNYDFIMLVQEMCIDNTGSIWFYSPDGIHQIIHKRENFRNYVPDAALNIDPGVTCIYPESKNLIFYGTQSGVYSLSRDINLNQKYYVNEGWEAGFPNFVNTMYRDRENTLWIGMAFKGLFSMFRSEDGPRRLKRNIPESVDTTKLREYGLYAIRNIFEDSVGRLWIGVNSKSSLHYFDRKRDQMIRLADNPAARYKLPKDAMIRHQTGSDTLWALGSSGVYKIILPLTKISEETVMPEDIIKCQITDINGQNIGISGVKASIIDSSGNIWLGTGQGLLKIYRNRMGETDAYEYSSKKFDMHQGLPSYAVKSIQTDDKGNLWIGTANGLSKFNIRSETFTNYSVRHGLLSSSFRPGSSAAGKDGELFFGTDGGMISFYPDSISINQDVDPVVITDISINNQHLQPGESDILPVSVSFTDKIELRHHQNNLSLGYAILNYYQPELNQYKYKLEGLNEDWIYAGNRTNVDFTNLDPGNYTFRVIGSNNDGVWNEEGASLRIIIAPPLWQSWYAYFVYILLAAGVAFWIYRYLSNRSRMRMAVEVERIEKQKLQELDSMRSRFFANVSHEFRTPLTLLLGPVEELGKKLPDLSDENKDLLKTMKRNTHRLQTLVNQLLDISKLETGKVKLEVFEGDLTGFVRTIVLSFLSLAESKKITYEYNLPEQKDKLFFDRDKLEKILTNLISNAFKFTPAGGKVTVDMKFLHGQYPETPDRVEISVSDTGKGIPEPELDKIFDRFYQVSDSDTREQEGTGIGLALTRELVELYRGEISVSSKVDRGSTFTVKLPILKEAFREKEIVEAPAAGKEKPVEEVYVSEGLEENEEPGSLAADKGTDGPFILIVEDNHDLRNYISRNLVSDYRILEAGNGREGFEKAAEEIPDLVITDLMMPEMDGMELCNKLKEDDRTSHIPVIMLTAKADRRSKLKGLETGADDYLIKPFDPEELQVRTKNLIDQRRKLREKFMGELTSGSYEETIEYPQDKLLHKVIDILKDNTGNAGFKTDLLAESLNMSRTQVFRKINALTGNSPGDLLRIIRLKKAARLLATGKLNITQVMYEVGFQTPAYFAKKFKEYYGVNPSEYRAQRR